MLLYYLFWMFINRHLYAILYIFGTNLLTESPVPVYIFLPVLEFRRKEIPNGVQME